MRHITGRCQIGASAAVAILLVTSVVVEPDL
jgi:hypothetical protein